MEWFQGITQPANEGSGRSHPSRLLSVVALFGLLFLPLLAGGAEVVLQHTDFTANCTLTPDALVHRSDEFFCGDQPVTIQCHVSLFSNGTEPVYVALAFDGSNHNDFPQCRLCGTFSGNSTMLAMEPVFSSDWIFSAAVGILTGTKDVEISQAGKQMPRVLLFPPYTHINTTLIMPEHYTEDRRFDRSGQYPAGLPYARYQLRLKDSTQSSTEKELPYDLRIRLDSEHNGNNTSEFQVFVNNGTVLPYALVPILVGPILRNMTLTPWQAGKPDCADAPLPSIGRHEHLDNIEYHFEPEPEVAAQWLEVAFPDIIGPLSSTTSAGQNLSSHCTNVLPAETLNCTVALADQPPLNWLLLRAGTLPDAETLNLTDLAAFWAIRQFSADDQGYHWQPAPVPATGYQLHIHCPDDAEYQDFVVEPRLEGGTGDSVHICNLTLTPQYHQQLWEEHSLKAEIQVRFNRSSSAMASATPSATPSETPIMVGVTSTVIPTGTPLPDEDKNAWEHWGRWATVGGAIGVVVGVALAAAGITYGVVNMRRQTLHGEKP